MLFKVRSSILLLTIFDADIENVMLQLNPHSSYVLFFLMLSMYPRALIQGQLLFTVQTKISAIKALTTRCVIRVATF